MTCTFGLDGEKSWSSKLPRPERQQTETEVLRFSGEKWGIAFSTRQKTLQSLYATEWQAAQFTFLCSATSGSPDRELA